MFDVRPIDRNGRLDLEKISSVRSPKRAEPEKQKIHTVNNVVPSTSDIRPSGGISFGQDSSKILENRIASQETALNARPLSDNSETLFSKPVSDIKDDYFEKEARRFRKILAEEKKQAEREKFKKHEVSVFSDDIDNVNKVTVEFTQRKEEDYRGEAQYSKYADEYDSHHLEDFDYFEKFKSPREKEKNRKEKTKKEKLGGFSLGDIFFYERYYRSLSAKKLAFSFAGSAFAIFIIIFGYNLINKGFWVKKTALENSEKAYASLISAKDGLSGKDFQAASMNFEEAYSNLEQISKDIDSLGSIVVESSKYIPYLSKLSSGSHLVEAGKDLSKAGALASSSIQTLDKIKNADGESKEKISYLKIFEDNRDSMNQIAELIKDASENLDSVNVSDVPEEKRNQFIALKEKLPLACEFFEEFTANEKIFADILGGNGPRKYLFLFQNNQEMRATGGFIGTYAVLDIFNGRVRKFFIDGIFNPDGQLSDRIVPPIPVQKISANWSMHDSNWWPDFPRSAEKATLFYEKTGGPTVDGVIAITPSVLEKFLAITGPIEMPEYDVIIDKDNFRENIQTEVEDNYDKELNQPKKILSDLAPKILDKMFNPENVSDAAGMMNALGESLNEKHILIYSKNWEIEKVLSAQGWSGEVLNTSKDYVSVINTNINGYKTDGVISEKISHKAEIQPDGSIIDTLTVTRHHNGGDTSYDWWNKVNADYMRVYVPKGSRLLGADGQTREFDSPPLDYDALGYKRDPQVKMEEDSMAVDEESGTRVYEDSGKTVFANWVYVSPQETVEMKYTYLLPFKIDADLTAKPADTYSLLAQKQSGSEGSEFSSEISYPDFYKTLWKYPDGCHEENNSLSADTDLKTDKFFGVALSKK